MNERVADKYDVIVMDIPDSRSEYPPNDRTRCDCTVDEPDVQPPAVQSWGHFGETHVGDVLDGTPMAHC